MNMSWQKHTNTKFQSCSIILQKIPNWQSNPQKKAYAKCDKKETNKNKLKVKKEKQIKLWLGSGSMLRWKGFFVVFFLILTDEWNKQSICKLYNNETTHHQNTNCDNPTLRVKKQTKEKKQHFRRKEAKQGGGEDYFFSSRVLFWSA